MLERRYWYGLNMVSWVLGAAFIGWFMPFLIAVFPRIGEILSLTHPSDITVFWLFGACPVLMMMDLATASPSEAKRATPRVYIVLFISVLITQTALGLMIIIVWAGEWRALYFPLSLLFLDAAILRTLLRRWTRDPIEPPPKT